MPRLLERGVDESSAFAILEIRRRRRDKGRILYQDRLTSVKFKDTSRHTSDVLEFTLDNSDGILYGDDLLMAKGTLVRLKFGYPGLDRDAGDFVIKKRKPSGTKLAFECHEAKRSQISRRPISRHWTEAKRSDVVRQTLQRIGYSGGFLDVDDSPFPIPIIMQHKEGDYQFVERLAEDEAKEFWIDDKGAHWKEPGRNKKQSRRSRYRRGVILVGNVTSEPQIEDFGASVPGRITVSGIDPLTGEQFTVSAADTDNQEEAVDGLVKLAETDTFLTPEEGDEEASGNDGSEIRMNIGSRSKAEAKLAADTLYKKYRYSALKLTVTVVMDPHLRPRRTIEVRGLGPAIDGKFYVKEVNHELSPGEFSKSTVEMNKDGLIKKDKPQKALTDIVATGAGTPGEVDVGA